MSPAVSSKHVNVAGLVDGVATREVKTLKMTSPDRPLTPDASFNLNEKTSSRRKPVSSGLDSSSPVNLYPTLSEVRSTSPAPPTSSLLPKVIPSDSILYKSPAWGNVKIDAPVMASSASVPPREKMLLRSTPTKTAFPAIPVGTGGSSTLSTFTVMTASLPTTLLSPVSPSFPYKVNVVNPNPFWSFGGLYLTSPSGISTSTSVIDVSSLRNSSPTPGKVPRKMRGLFPVAL
mmetsp:Transcript_17435/g.36024  ORF Transcript_17435/g.36024 Transcript_17435/m.36024 type:complete len:232 (-) Transcript_17435:1205-1900(-)